MNAEDQAQEPTKIEKTRVREVCKMDGLPGELCSYLGFRKGWVCLKGSHYGDVIEGRRRRGDLRAGDNCSGPPDFKERRCGEEAADAVLDKRDRNGP